MVIGWNIAKNVFEYDSQTHRTPSWLMVPCGNAVLPLCWPSCQRRRHQLTSLISHQSPTRLHHLFQGGLDWMEGETEAGVVTAEGQFSLVFMEAPNLGRLVTDWCSQQEKLHPLNVTIREFAVNILTNTNSTSLLSMSARVCLQFVISN